MNEIEDNYCRLKALIAYAAMSSHWEAEGSFANTEMSQDACWGRHYVLEEAYDLLKQTMEHQVIPLTLKKEAS